MAIWQQKECNAVGTEYRNVVRASFKMGLSSIRLIVAALLVSWLGLVRLRV